MIKLFTAIAYINYQLVASLNADPCSLPTPPTVTSCWDCFQSMLADCDAKNREAERRKACYEGANNFFVWCLGRASTPKSLSTAVPDSFIQNHGLSLELSVSNLQETDSITVYSLTESEQKREVTQLKIYHLIDGNNVSVLVDDYSIPTDDDNLIGIMVVVRNADEKVVMAKSSVVRMIIDGDLNSDLQVNALDLPVLWQMFANDQVTFEEYLRLYDLITSR